MLTLDDHHLANLFPLIEGEEFDALAADIKAHGLHDPIDLYQGKILDGRNRYRAAMAAGVELEKRNFRNFVPEFFGNPLDYVLGKNLKRRHLNESQRAMVAARLATMRQGERTDITEPSANLPKVDAPKVPQETAARTLSISERALRHARATQQTGTPALIRAVERGKLAVSQAAQAARLSPEIQDRIAGLAEDDAANAVRTAVKQEARAAREADLGERQTALPDKKYGVILADPEWRFEPYSRETGMDRAPENHYSTSTTDVIASRDVGSIAADDCVLWLWATSPMLPQALAVMAAWGFDYKTHAIWHKLRNGLGRGSGYWFTGEHELILIGTRGKVVAPATALCGSVIAAPWQGSHSAKPEAIAELIERAFPSLPKIELNRRGAARPGWDAWGNESLPPHDPDTGEIIESELPTPANEGNGRTEEALAASAAAMPPATSEPAIDPMAIPHRLRRVAS